MDDNYVLKEGSPTSPMLDEHSIATIIEKTVDVSDIGEFIIGESNSSIITFRMNRYYDGVDLLDKTIKIMYRNSNGIYESDVVNIKYTSNSLKFSWIVPHDATKTKKLLAYVCFVSNGYLWKTRTFTITVDQSFDVGDSEPTQNWFVNIESKLTKIEKTIDELLNDVIPQKIKEVETSISKQIPTKVSDLENDSAVSYSAQELTLEQKQQARDNIGVKKYEKYDIQYSKYKRTIWIVDGQINVPADDADEELKNVYTNFIYKINGSMILGGNLSWNNGKDMLLKFSNANKKEIIPDTFAYYADEYYKKLIVFYHYKDNSGKDVASLTWDNRGAYSRYVYYPDTGEYLDDFLNTKREEPLLLSGYGVDNDKTTASQFELSKNPTADMEVATKQYVDNNTMSVDEINTLIDTKLGVIENGTY